MAGANITKDVVEPILASTLPGPLSNLRFVKLDLGHVPIRFDHVDVHKTTNEGIKLDMDVDWEGVCDIELDGNLVPKIVSFLLLQKSHGAMSDQSTTICRASRKFS